MYFPPSIAITNYDRVLVGEEEALEAGAFVARVRDTTSGWYNPAGMAALPRSAIGASASGFETDLLSLEGVGSQRGGGMTVYQLPSYFGAVLGRDVIDSEHWRFGFTITKPTAWDQSIVAGATNGTTTIAYSSHVGLSTLVPMVSVSYSPFASLRFGAGVGVALSSLGEIQTLSGQVATPTSANSFLRTLDGSGSIWNLVGTLGAQWDITENLVLGGMMRTPGLKIVQSGSLTYQNVSNLATPWNRTYFNDQGATFDYRLPLDLTFGLAWRSKDFELEVDVRYHSAIPQYYLLTSTQPVSITTTGPDGNPVYTTQPFPGVTNGARTVWNLALGGRYNLNESWSFHGGFFTDASPTNESGANLFRSVDMYGVTVGAKLRGDHLSGSLGLGYSWGSSEPFPFGETVTGTPTQTRLTITSLTLLYAVAYKF